MSVNVIEMLLKCFMDLKHSYCTQVNKMTTGFGIVDVASYVNTIIGYGNKIIVYNTKADELLDTLRPCHLSVIADRCLVSHSYSNGLCIESCRLCRRITRNNSF